MKLSDPVQYVKGVGPAIAKRLEHLHVFTVEDLLYLLPARYIDRRRLSPIGQVEEGKERVVIGLITRAGVTFLGKKQKRIFEAVVEDASGQIILRWFHFHLPSLTQQLYPGATVLFAGEVVRFGPTLQMIHPELELLDQEGQTSQIAGKILPIYPLTEGLYQKTLRKIIRNAWDHYGKNLQPTLPITLLEKYQLVDPWEAVAQLHFPASDLDVDLLNTRRSAAHTTLIFDEFFFLELGLALKNKHRMAEAGIAFPFQHAIQEKFIACLPFEWTESQKKAFAEICEEMGQPHPMNRLLQGDVGSGKTVVAVAAALQAIANGHQAAFMAPTEILAEQHFRKLLPWFQTLGIPIGLLTGSTSATYRTETLQQLARGELPLILGTHALIEGDVHFAKLGLVIIDEQHRFGVLQRLALHRKGLRPDVLVMTATPIPRTLAMTLYGDLEISVIRELPQGRKPIHTRLYHENQRERLYDGLKSELAKGHQAYVVYPLIEESEKLDLKNATDMACQLRKVFAPNKSVALLHGRLSSDEKNFIMEQFRSGAIGILATTSVIEVGIDIPNATVMVIEHAERFGLSQLHQLRGRVGRGSAASYCILMGDYRRSEEAQRRLQVMVETCDGFRIAEEDLAIRGPGEFLGTRQSGLPEFKVANVALDGDILSAARKAAFEWADAHATDSSAQHQEMLKTLHRRWQGKLDLMQVS